MSNYSDPCSRAAVCPRKFIVQETRQRNDCSEKIQLNSWCRWLDPTSLFSIGPSTHPRILALQTPAVQQFLPEAPRCLSRRSRSQQALFSPDLVALPYVVGMRCQRPSRADQTPSRSEYFRVFRSIRRVRSIRSALFFCYAT